MTNDTKPDDKKAAEAAETVKKKADDAAKAEADKAAKDRADKEAADEAEAKKKAAEKDPHEGLVKVKKEGTVLHVHPSTLAAHKEAGWHVH